MLVLYNYNSTWPSSGETTVIHSYILADKDTTVIDN